MVTSMRHCSNTEVGQSTFCFGTENKGVKVGCVICFIEMTRVRRRSLCLCLLSFDAWSSVVVDDLYQLLNICTLRRALVFEQFFQSS